MKICKMCFTLFLVFLVFLSIRPHTSLAEIHHLTILHTSNHQGHFAKFSLPGNPDVGGMAARSTIINTVRAEVESAGGHVLLLSTGNVNIGTPESDLLNAEPDFRLMNMLGYDAMTLGHGEFCTPRDMLKKQREWGGFPFLAANIVKKETGELLEFAKPYIIKNFDGLKVAIFGLTREIMPSITLYAEDLDSQSVIETAQELVSNLRTETDLVIALTHTGFSEELRATGDLQLAEAVSGIDVIVGARLEIISTVLEEPEVIDDTLIVQAGGHGLYVGRLDLTVDSEADSILEYRYKLIPVNLKHEVKYQGKSYYAFIDQGYVEDSAVLEFMQPSLEQVNELLSQPVGETLVRLDGIPLLLRYQETSLANLVTDAMRAKTGAEIAFINAGAIVMEANIEPGPITYRDILNIHPYGNTLVLLDLTGEQVMEVLNYAATFKIGQGNFLHISGLTWTRNKGLAEHVTMGGLPIDLDRLYKVVITSALAGGVDGHIFKELPQFNTGFFDADATREYIQKMGKVAPKIEGRLTIIE
ncbi:MAG: bifunctional UDP-sugar hydrolase/5'-nucleotidase [bacterium]|nr:bifunctional UDP-sugar hydrolase/5'-nucleotidase [bacterium]